MQQALRASLIYRIIPARRIGAMRLGGVRLEQ